MALQSDYRKTNCAGGYVPNFRGTVEYNENMDVLDNPHMIGELKGIRDLSVTQRSYPRPPPMKTGRDPLPYNCAPSESGFTRARATHPPDTLDIFRTHRARLLMSGNPLEQLTANCKVPDYMGTTETKEAFTKDILTRATPDWHTHFPGNKDSGFTHAFNPNPLDGRHLDPIWAGGPPDMGRLGPSVSHQDYLPYKIKSGKEFTLPIAMTGRTVTGFNRFKELQPCFSDHSWKGPCRDFETSYTHDYPRKQSHCDISGKQVYGKGFKIAGNMGTVNLFEGPGFYISEAMERYTSPVKEGRARHGHLRGAVDNFNQTSGFATSTHVHNPFVDPCRSAKMGDRSAGPLDPTRYNPWPRYLVGHRSMLDKNYRPHPVSEAGTGFEVLQVEPGSIFKDFPTLI